MLLLFTLDDLPPLFPPEDLTAPLLGPDFPDKAALDFLPPLDLPPPLLAFFPLDFEPPLFAPPLDGLAPPDLVLPLDLVLLFDPTDFEPPPLFFPPELFTLDLPEPVFEPATDELLDEPPLAFWLEDFVLPELRAPPELLREPPPDFDPPDVRFDIPLGLLADLPAIAPITPPTTVPIGPAMLPITAPAAAPAACLEIVGIWMFSDDLDSPPDCSFCCSAIMNFVVGIYEV